MNETKLACGCRAEWTGERWQISASSFLCDHKQGDPVDGAPPDARDEKLTAIRWAIGTQVNPLDKAEALAALDSLVAERDEALKEAEFYEIECSAARQEVDDAQADAKDAREKLTMLRDAWNAHMHKCPYPSTDSCPTREEVEVWMNAPSDTASGAGS